MTGLTGGSRSGPPCPSWIFQGTAGAAPRRSRVWRYRDHAVRTGAIRITIPTTISNILALLVLVATTQRAKVCTGNAQPPVWLVPPAKIEANQSEPARPKGDDEGPEQLLA